jgi:glycosyltransferase involved in cell wall biosynthesis
MSQGRARKMPHIGHVVDCFGAGGIATGVLELIRATRHVVRHSIISLADDLRLLAQLPAPPHAYVVKPGPTRLLGFSSRLAWLVCTKQIDILHCNNHFAWLDSGLAARLTGCACLQTFHGVEKPLAEMPHDVRVKCRLAARLGTAVTAVSEASRVMVCTLGGLPARAVEVIANGVDLARFRPCPDGAADRRALRQALGVAADGPVAVHVAGLRPIKDQATLLRAWRGVLDGWPQGAAGPVLAVAGEGECGPALHALAAELRLGDAVRFLGQRRDLDTLLPACDLFVLSSLSEGMSYAILEALAARLPVVATRVGGNGELVRDGENGLLVPARDPAALAGALGRLLGDADERRRLARHGRQLVERHYDQAVAAGRYVELYTRLTRRRPPRQPAAGRTPRSELCAS